MTTRRNWAAGLILLGYFVAQDARATMLVETRGDVRVDAGEGFRPAASATPLKQGDSVLVSKGGTAELLFSDGCSCVVAEGAVAPVATRSPCENWSVYPKPYRIDALSGQVERFTSIFGERVAPYHGLLQCSGKTAGAEAMPQMPTPVQSPAPAAALGAGGGLSTGMVLVGAAAIGGGVVIATGSKSSSRRRPASP